MKTIVTQVGQGLSPSTNVLEVKGFPMRVFCTNSPDFSRQILTHPKVGTTKAPQIMPRVRWAMYDAGAYIIQGGEQWRKRRMLVQPTVSPPQLEYYLKDIENLMQPYLQNWRARAHSGETFDVFVDLRRIVTQFNFKMIFGTYLDDDTLRTIEKCTLFADRHFVSPVPLWVPTPNNIKFKKSVTTILAALHRHTKLAMQKPELADRSMVSFLIGKIADREIIGELASIYFGASVMSTSLAWALSLIGSHPDVMQRLHTEAQGLKASSSSLRESLADMKYSSAVLSEVLRLYPPSWGYPRLATENFQLGDDVVPSGSLVIPMVYLIQRDPRFWPEPEAFKPDRFLDAKTNVKPHTYFPFGMGARSCLGSAIAPSIMQLILLMAAREFNFELKPRFAGDPKAEFGFEIHPESEIFVRAIKK